MVNPGGTGIPILVISARFAPLPPSRSFHSRVPSARPSPKKKTFWVTMQRLHEDEPGALRAGPVPLDVDGGLRGVLPGEAGVAEALRSVRHGTEHAVE